VRSSDGTASVRAREAAAAAGYALGPFLGEGTFKVCFAATAQSGAEVAFKILKPNAVLARTERELAAMRNCDHPNIARCLDSGSVDVGGGPVEYVVEERFEGGSLKDRLIAHGGPLDRASVLQIGERLIDAVAHIGTRNLVHRDIKPDNIMFRPDGQPILTDFGIVRALSEKSLTETARAYGLGTPSYMPLINWRADQFALGVTMSLAALGIHPFGEDFRKQVDAIARYAHPTARFVGAAQTAGLPVLVKMVQPYPIQRFSDPAVLQQEWATQGP
jgi:serine/threonine protein kinase